MNVDATQIVKSLVSSEGDIFLASERLSKDIGFKLNEYQFIDEIISNKETAKLASEQLRSLLTIKMFYLITQLQTELLGNLDAIPPKDLARTLASFVTAFSSITAPATKETFDFEAEVNKLADEFELTPEEVRLELKQMFSKNK